MCIVTVAGHGVGGMQDHTRSLAKGLVERGHEVEVLTTRHPAGLVAEILDGATWHYLDAPHHHPWLPRRHRAWLSRSHDMFWHLHRRRPFDLIHSESTSAIGLVRRGVHRKVPLVAKFHGTTISVGRVSLQHFLSGDARVKVREAKALLWILAGGAQYGQWYRFRPCVWMAPSRSELEDTRRSLTLRREFGYVVPNGVDVSVFTPRPKQKTREDLGLRDLPLFVCAGRLDPAKGTHHAIRALEIVGSRGHAARLAILGEGPDRARLEALADALGISSAVIFTGAQPHEVLARYLAAAEALLFPTRQEAAPLVPLQALACGTPVIASTTPATLELISRPGENGLLVGAGGPEAVAAAMERILLDAELRRTLRRNGLARIEDGYTIDGMIDRTLAVYNIARNRFHRPVSRRLVSLIRDLSGRSD